MYYIIIRGPAGAGKSAGAKRLAKSLKGYYVSFDKIMRKHRLDKIERGHIKASDFMKANEIAAAMAMKKLGRGQVVVFDGCFYHRSQLENLIRKLRCRHFVFSLKAPLEKCIENDSKRKGKSRIGPSEIRNVHKLASRFDHGTKIYTDGKTAAQIANEIRKNIKQA